MKLDQIERGSGSVMMVGVIGCGCVLALTLGALTGIEVQRAKTQTTADLAALSAAQIATGYTDMSACSGARRVCEQAHVELASCTITGTDAFIEVTKPVFGGGSWWQVRAFARAGPPD